MLQRIVKLTNETSEVVDILRRNTTIPEFEELPINEQTNIVVNRILENTFQEVDMDDILLLLGLV